MYLKTASHCGKLSSQWLQIVAATKGRLQDFDKGVRCAAIVALCECYTPTANVVSVRDLQEVASRLRDTQSVVRKQALTSLIRLFHSHCADLDQISGVMHTQRQRVSSVLSE